MSGQNARNRRRSVLRQELVVVRSEKGHLRGDGHLRLVRGGKDLDGALVGGGIYSDRLGKRCDESHYPFVVVGR